jgi:hypothetical protein
MCAQFRALPPDFARGQLTIMPEPEFVTCFENIKEAWALLDSLDKQEPNTGVESIARIKALYAESVPLQDKLKKDALYAQRDDRQVDDLKTDLIELESEIHSPGTVQVGRDR